MEGGPDFEGNVAPERPWAGAGPGGGGCGLCDDSGGGGVPPCRDMANAPPERAIPATTKPNKRAAVRTRIAASYFKGFALMLTLLSLEYILKSMVSQSTWPLMVAVCLAISRAKASNDGFF